MTKRCFVIQPFDDGGDYDRRYTETFQPAIADAGFEAYRIDKDPGVDVLIEEIERGISDSIACLADISTNNPNVWYELGYAMSHGRIVVLICSDERTNGYPFDVRHRKIIRYSTKSMGGYVKLRGEIATHLRKRFQKMQDMDALPFPTSISQSHGLEQYEVAALVTVAEEVDRTLWANRFHEDMQMAGFTRIAASLSRQSLVQKGMLEENEPEETGSFSDTALRVTAAGMKVLFSLVESGELTLRSERPSPEEQRQGNQPLLTEPDDDLPF